MKQSLKPTQKDKNLFLANIGSSFLLSILAGFIGASFYDLVNIFELSKTWRITFALLTLLVGYMKFFSSKSRLFFFILYFYKIIFSTNNSLNNSNYFTKQHI